MRRPCRLLALCVPFVCLIGLARGQGAANPPVPELQDIENAASAIDRFVARPEPAYDWKLIEKLTQGGVTIYRLELTSQTWQEITWKHSLTVFEPAEVSSQDHAILFVAGGSNLNPPGLDEQLLAISIAQLSGGRVALLKQVPNQPLLGGRKEDDLITETWLRYLESGDENWPLLFPMVKSAVKAMDAVGELGEQERWPEPVEKFVITGASKRGWTSWLTPVVDDRIVATAPIVIDTLNFRKQMRHQKETWGTFSEQIADYTSKGLVRVNGEPETPREKALMTMMDPWTYRDRLKLPKLMINGTNDRYWVVDAAKNYYGGLIGPKNVLEIPNAGHSLNGGRGLAVAGIAALFRAASHDKQLPKLTWEFTGTGENRLLKLTSDTPPREARLWTATSPTNDFREAEWSSQSVSGDNGHYQIAVPDLPDANTRQAIFGELEFVDETISPPLTYSLTTIVKCYLPAQR